MPTRANVVCDAHDGGKRYVGHRGGAGHGKGFQVLQGTTGKFGGRCCCLGRRGDAERAGDIGAGQACSLAQDAHEGRGGSRLGWDHGGKKGVLARKDLRQQADGPCDGRTTEDEFGPLSRIDARGADEQYCAGLVFVDQPRGCNARLDHAHADAGQGRPPSHPRGQIGQARAQVGKFGRPGRKDKPVLGVRRGRMCRRFSHDARKCCVSGGAGILPIS